MQVVIMAGGKGTRLGPLTEETPKPMVKINERPFLEHQLELLKSFGFYKILLLTGYKGEKIMDYFKDGRAWNLSIKYSVEKELLGTGGALKNAEDKLEKEFLVLNGDTYLRVDYHKIIRYFMDSGKKGVAAVVVAAGSRSRPNIKIGGFGKVVDYDRNDPERMTHVHAGISILNKCALDCLSGFGVYTLEDEVFPRLIKKNELAACLLNERFYDMGDIESLKEIAEVLR